MKKDRSTVTPAERTLRLIDARLDEPLTIGRLAGEAHQSEFHFIRQFRRQYYVTPHQYLTRKRIDRARKLLSETDLSVTDICFEVGFQSLGSFSHLFRRTVGWAPSVYRARCRERRREPRRFIPTCFWIMHRLEPLETAGGPTGHTGN